MNTLIKYTLVLALCATTTVLATAQSNIGYVNSVALLQEIPEVKQADANLKDLQTQLEKKGQSMVEEFQKKYQELQVKEQNGELSPKMLEEEGARLQEEQTKIQQYEQDMQKQLAEKQQTLLQPILDRVNAQIAEVAKEEGMNFILDSSNQVLLYADETKDVTEKVRAKLGL